MSMTFVQKGTRTSASQVRISTNAKVMYFSSGFFRKHETSKVDAKYARLGYDKETGNIGVEFLQENKKEKALIIAYPNNGSSGSCSIRAILSVFGLHISEIAGIYGEDAIKANVPITGWTEKGFLLITSKRKKEMKSSQ